MFMWPTSELPIWACRQPDPFLGGVDGGVRVGRPQEIPVRLARLADRVELAFLAVPEAVEYDQQDRGDFHGVVILAACSRLIRGKPPSAATPRSTPLLELAASRRAESRAAGAPEDDARRR